MNGIESHEEENDTKQGKTRHRDAHVLLVHRVLMALIARLRVVMLVMNRLVQDLVLIEGHHQSMLTIATDIVINTGTSIQRLELFTHLLKLIRLIMLSTAAMRRR